jgi:hypothetical protein
MEATATILSVTKELGARDPEAHKPPIWWKLQ